MNRREEQERTMTDTKSHQHIRAVNPATEEVVGTYPLHSEELVEEALQKARDDFRVWRTIPFAQRSKLMKQLADNLSGEAAGYAATIAEEMGKPIAEAEAEIRKCAWLCNYYAEHAEGFLREDPHSSGATESYVQYLPLGTVLAVMPWNYPFWQVFRCAVPAIMAGNNVILKHASNVPLCSLTIDGIFRDAGFAEGTFISLLVPSSAVSRLIADPRICAVAITGSEAAGSNVAAQAGGEIKKTVLELGGSDPFIVLEDADLLEAVPVAVRARFQNTGQSCIAAKRFIVVDSLYDRFCNLYTEMVRTLKVGDPTDRATQIGPLARQDLLEELDRQVEDSVSSGARLLEGGKRRNGKGYFYEPTVLGEVPLDSPAAREEVFGPVAAILRVKDQVDAVQVANSSSYGLGASIWSRNTDRAKLIADDLEAGQVFVNGMVASDPRLPFGGVKKSGYGRELSREGIREFVNTQTVWIGPGNS
jgi:succinate-semialdehyde dehydrogenase/glutarate-semialdehyde dehydrogenase